MESLIHIIYASAATVPFDADALVQLLAKARKNNESLGVTGMLLHTEGNFFQVLEGAESTVTRLFDSISLDPRHGKVVRIIQEPIAERSFGAWSMDFTALNREQLRSIPGATDIFSQGPGFQDLDNGRAKKLLGAFLNGRWRISAA